MRIHAGINLPEELISAQRAGKLVVFAGAGVSKDPPSSYPNFTELALEVNKTAGNILPIDTLKPIERFLGKLDKFGVNVHGLVKQMLSRNTSKPNQLHRDIVELFDEPRNIRIVTTNFDRHFATALSDAGLNVPIYSAPALPLGGLFSGLIYLHGNVDQDESQLIITDEDFGKAYLVDSWATRFLGSLFAEYTVLFIGYSHSDEIMTYLSRGLPPSSSRFTLARHEEEDNWRYYNITPVGFPEGPPDDKFSYLREGIRNWTKLIQMDSIDHGKKIKVTTKKVPAKLTNVEEDYILYCLSKIETARIFTHYVKTVNWFSWLDDKGIINSLFSPFSTASEIQWLLASWICELFLLNDSEIILEAIEKKGQKINATLWGEIANRLSYDQKISPATRAIWVALLLNNLPPNNNTGEMLSRILSNCKFPKDSNLIIVLFEYLISPHQHLEKHFNFSADKSAPKVLVDVTVPGELYHLGEAWKNLIDPNIKDFAVYLEKVVSVNLMRAHYIQKASGKANSSWDSQSFRRSSIEPHEQDKYANEFDILINAARRVMEYFAAEDEQKCKELTETWVHSKVPLLKRIAVHGVFKSFYYTPEAKIAWVLEHDILFDLNLRREIFLLFEHNYCLVSEALRKRVLKNVLRPAAGNLARKKDRERRAYEVYSMVEWLHRNAPSCKPTEKNFLAHSKKWPHFMPRPNPEFLSWSTVGFTQFETPILAADLLVASLQESLDTLMNYRINEDGIYRRGLLRELGMAVTMSFPWSMELFHLLEGQKNVPQDIWQSFFQSWQDSELTFSQMKKIIQTLIDSPVIDLMTKEICHFLAFKIANAEPPRPVVLWNLSDKLGAIIWGKVANKPIDSKADNDHFQNAFLCEGGMLAEFVVSYLHRLQNKSSVFPSKIRYRLNSFITETGDAATAAKIVLLSHVGFLAAKDSLWVKTQLLPLLDCTKYDNDIYWSGLLEGELHKDIVDDIVYYLGNLFKQKDGYSGTMNNKLSELIATICVFHNGFNPLKDGWLINFLKYIQDGGTYEWTAWIRRNLVDVSEPDREVLWKTWMRDYLILRLNGIPKSLENRELVEIIGWTLSFKSIFQEVINTIKRFDPPNLTASSFFFWVKKSQLSDSPEDLADLMLYLFEKSQHDRFSGQHLNEIAQTFNGKLHSRTKIRRLNNTLVRHGVYEILDK